MTLLAPHSTEYMAEKRLAETYADASRALQEMTRSRATLATAWRHSLLSVEEHLLFIKQHRKTIAERNERLACGVPVHRPAYVAHCRRCLAIRLPDYLAAVRRVTEYELEMDRLGIPYAKSSYAAEAV